MASYVLTLILAASLIASMIAIYVAMIRQKDMALILGIATTVVLVANVLFLLYLLALCLDWDVPFLGFFDFFVKAGLAEAFKITPILALFSLTLLFPKRLRRFTPVLILLIVANVLLSVFVFFKIASSF